MKTSNTMTARALLSAIALLAGWAAAPAQAGTAAPTVVSGQASFQQLGNVYSITNTPGAIIQWPAFSVAAGQVTRFVQQSPASSVLNRITGQAPSLILGTLQSNGRVFLINPNGVLFGADSRVDVKGLVASSLGISNADFLAGKMNFSAGATAGGVANQGQITTPDGGRVILIAPNVENSGIIRAPGGEVVLAAGRSVQLADTENPDLHVVVSAPQDQAVNLGQIVAQSGRVGIYGNLVNQRGLVSADSAVLGANGQIVFKASGDLTLEAGSVTTANGTGDGDGGKVIAKADGTTHMLGSISARGGANSGDGGFVEVSGQVLDMQGRVDTRAPNGRTGTLLLDPTNIYIANNLASAQAAGMVGTDGSADNFIASGAVADSLLSVGTLQSALTTSVVVVSTANPAGTGAGFIRVVDPVSWTTDTSLTLNATAGISINALISGGPGSGLQLSTTSGNITQSSPITVETLSARADTGGVYLTNAGNQVGLLAGFAGGSGGFNFNNGATSLSVGVAGPETGITTLGTGPINLTAGGGLMLTSPIGSQAGDIVVAAAGTFSNFSAVTSTSGRITIQGIVVQPSLADCTANPALAGCTSVLPTLTSCQANPNLAGCSAVLPQSTTTSSPVDCVADPAAAGCGTVQPTLAQCTASPTLPGCSNVLPTLSTCVANPTAPGCAIVLPTLAQCTTTPTLAGCSAVLPTVSACTANPTAPGCGVVLPTLAQCSTTPALAGCGVVLPTISACTSNPAAPGCNVVLPTLAQCTVTPTAAGCSAVLPSIAQCVSTPSAPGCAVILPALASCVAAPAQAGCSAVLPSVASCTANAAQPGCGAVLPTLAQCSAAPATAGCSAVLPTLAQCVGSPTQQGCSAVLPPVSTCASNPAAAGCAAVLPPIATQTPANAPVNQAINTTVTLVNTITNAVNGTVTALFIPSNQQAGGTSSTSIPGSSSPASPGTSTGKKMYCN